MKVLAFKFLNPEPWSAPELGTKRVGNKVVPTATKKAVQRSYQEAIESFKERIRLQPFPRGTAVRVTFYLARQLEKMKLAGGGSRTRQWADATNMQKALEDALQKILYENDNQVRSVRTIILEEDAGTEPLIVIECEEWKAAHTEGAWARVHELLQDAPDSFEFYEKET